MALKPLICCKCGIEIKGGFFNAPSGVHCCDCWLKKTPRAVRDKVYKDALKVMATIGKSFK
jgi:hypothetical protein